MKELIKILTIADSDPKVNHCQYGFDRKRKLNTVH